MSKKYQRLALIGSGSFGKAWLVTRVGHTKKMISKEIKVSQLTQKETDQCVTEVMVLASCNHANIIQYIDAYVEERCLYIVMEFADGGDLQRRIFKQNGIYFAKEVILEWFVQIMMALEYIHSRNILHRDLKSQNVFLTGSDIIKLGDFGIAKVLQSENDLALTTIGTPFYISPEICQKKPYNSSSDMWAAGCLLFEMCLLRMPFMAPNFTSLVLTILQGSYDPLPRYFGPVLQQLVSSLLLIQPSSRLTASQVLNLPEISTIVKKLQSKHSDIYTTSRSRSPGSNYRESRGHRLRSRSPGVDKLPKEVHAGDRDSTEIKRNRLSNRVAPLKDRNRQDLIKSSHQGRSLTPDLRRVRRGERQNSEPRRHSYSNNEKENAPYENVRGSVLKSSNDKNRTEKNDFNLKEGNKRLTPCISKVKAGDTKQHVVGSEASGAGPVNTRENNDKNNSSKISQKTYVIKESVLRRLSQASPVLSETVRQQRASLSLDMELQKSSEVKTPTASLFSCENGHGAVNLSSNNKSPAVDDSLDVFDQSEDNVFEFQDMASEVKGTARFVSDLVGNPEDRFSHNKAHIAVSNRVEENGVYETGPFDVDFRKRRVDSTTYTVKSGSVNNNYNTENILDVNEVLYLAASVSKQNPKLGRDILHDSVVSHLGPSAAGELVSMVTKNLDAGQSYQSLVKCLYETEKVIMPIIINLYNLS